MTLAVVHPKGWVLSHLVDGDQLSNLASEYGIGAREIVEGNGVTWSSRAIEGDGGWIHKKAGGKRIKNSDGSTLRWVFDRTSKIYLPPGGPRRPVNAPPPTSVGGRALKFVAAAVVAVGVTIGGIALAKRRKRRTS